MASPDAQRVKDALDIAEVVGEYVSLKKAGGNFKGLCPFHSEKTPSFNVHPERQIWHCFGCDEGGDVISFVQKVEGMEFPDALTLLAKRAGIVLKPPTPAQKREQSQRTQLLEIMRTAKAFYHQALLRSEAGAAARAYLRDERGISDDTIAEWQIGFAPDEWDQLSRFLKKRGHEEKQIIAAGLASPGKKGSAYDRFRGRVLFPLCDVHGETVGFTGRVLPGAPDDAPKYLNSPQTPLYDKSQVLFGLHVAKKTIRNEGKVVLVEGQMDVVSSHQANIRNVVAASGTALTAQQVTLLKRFCSQIVLAFDVDLAGSEATKRGILLAIEAGLDVRVARVPDGKDPDECIRQSPETWKRVIDEAVAVMEFVFDLAREGREMTNVQDKKAVVADVLEMLRAIPDPIEQEHYVQKLAAIVRVDEELIRSQLKQMARGNSSLAQPTQPTQKPPQSNTSVVQQNTTEDVRDPLSESLLQFLFFDPTLLERFEKDFREEAIHEDLLPLYKAIRDTYTRADGNSGKEIIRRAVQEAMPELASRIDALLLSAEEMWGDTDLSASVFHEAFRVAQHRLMERYVRSSLRLAQKALDQAERAGETDRVQLLSEKIQRMFSLLNTLSHGSNETQEDNQEEARDVA